MVGKADSVNTTILVHVSIMRELDTSVRDVIDTTRKIATVSNNTNYVLSQIVKKSSEMERIQTRTPPPSPTGRRMGREEMEDTIHEITQRVGRKR